MADSEDRSVEEIVDELEERVSTLEDQVMMERLEDLSIEEEIDIVQDVLDRSPDEIRDLLGVLEEVEEKYEDLQVDDKLRYLYSNLQDLQESAVTEEDIQELRESIQKVDSKIQQAGSAEGDRSLDDAYDKLFTIRDRVQDLQSQ
ncbi:MAG: hypothetical protein SVQ76_01715, partial [Candidatus Nanohaloarchaea archaeon]|nr:hypothetical protein [Candidatus Nanohaloarchaea archaeon]